MSPFVSRMCTVAAEEARAAMESGGNLPLANMTTTTKERIELGARMCKSLSSLYNRTLGLYSFDFIILGGALGLSLSASTPIEDDDWES